MKLEDLVTALDSARLVGSGETVITGLSYDSRSTRPGDLFIAVQGTHCDTHCDGSRFAAQAVERGAAAVLTDRPLDPALPVPRLRVEDARAAKARVAAEFYRHPSRSLDCVGVTGTNGKTTVTHMLKSILDMDGRSTGLIGTIHHQIGKRTVVSRNTTPDPVELQRYLAEMVDENQSTAVMEVSSHALSQDRVGQVDFKVGIFTNLTRDHLDYHGTMEAYAEAKSRLFRMLPEDAAAVINGDDPAAKAMAKAARCRVVRYGFSPGCQVTAELRRLDIDGFSMILETPEGAVDVTSRLPGRFNVMNALAASAAALALGAPLSAVKIGLETLRSIRGRMESVDCGQDFRVIVDYAHTHDALKNLLSHLKPLTAGRLITVFGCGGDRDRTKRPLMAQAAAALSDHLFVTSDNPRSEDPGAIIEDILKGVEKGTPLTVEPDRKSAIEQAIAMAAGGDIVVIAGKGHENYQILKDETVDFDDRTVAEEALWTRYR
jgi:UDP-N-acetylmuramoyl-L-alanyl-D-glutamate--2,6-diaminopimelate ligase